MFDRKAYQKKYYTEHKQYWKNWLEKNPNYMREYKKGYRKKIGLRTEKPNYQRESKIRIKLRLIKILGSACSSCGYKKNYSALEFHEKTESENLKRKVLGKYFTAINLYKLNKLSESELKEKITLFCANCHREKHHPSCILE